jgi:hypothetical protein
MRRRFQQVRHRDDKGRPQTPSEFGQLPPKRVGRISPGNSHGMPSKKLQATQRTQREISIPPLPKVATVRTPHPDTFLHIVPGIISASTGVLVYIA